MLFGGWDRLSVTETIFLSSSPSLTVQTMRPDEINLPLSVATLVTLFLWSRLELHFESQNERIRASNERSWGRNEFHSVMVELYSPSVLNSRYVATLYQVNNVM